MTPDPTAVSGMAVADPLKILDSVTTAVLVANANNRILYANAAAEQMAGTSARVLCARRLEDVTGGSSALVAMAARCRARGSLVSERDVALTFQQRQQQIVDIQVAPSADEQGVVVFSLHSRSLAALPEVVAQSHGAARSAMGLSAMLAHEIKNPLSGIRGAAQLLDRRGGQDSRELTHLIRDEVDRIAALVDQMETLSNPPPTDAKAENIHAVLDHVIRLAQAGFASHATVTSHYDVSLPPVHGFRDQLIQIFINLMKNAAEHTKDSGQIIVRTSYRRGLRLTGRGRRPLDLHVEVSIEDEGGGIPEDLLENIFVPFVTTKEGGGGLGLAVVAKYLDDMGGTVSCDNTARGARFRVLLPASRLEEDSQ